ncbi:MAG: histidine kinase dimerization/phosphoacceptor domain -containing protein [Methanosarcina sp.]
MYKIALNALENFKNINTRPDVLFDFLKLISFYFIYKAIVQTASQNPYNFYFKGIKDIEGDIIQKMDCLGNNCERIYKMSGISKHLTKNRDFNKEFKESNNPEYYDSFMQNLQGIGFQFDRNCSLIFMHGAVEEITGYKKEEILSGKIDWINIIKPEDRFVIFEKREKLKSNPDSIVESEYRICRKDGETKWVREIIQRIPENQESSGRFKVEEFQGLIYDITKRKMSEEALEKIDRIRIREVHHRIKNNLQVISSLLSLQAEQFEDEKVIEAFKESQKRIESIALIHEELHEGEGTDSLDFADYLHKLIKDLSNSYRVDNNNINFKLELEQVNLSMSTAIPLGIVVNELISNSLKYAFPDKKEGEIWINFCKIEAFSAKYEIPEPDQDYLRRKNSRYVLRVKDNGKGIPEEIDFQNPDTLGLQLINVLVEQIGGLIHLKREHGTEFIILF